ncbi:MAG: hypothetical protein CVV64_02280 [Candidatus Wallbacteria bacterium HGW-Wallbacteria-1]|jgi:L-threonylcarbamoyladenylate synthase|uniref:L-threonylcarbamoyladenylate synthase n=1 Tax=Candidatus Wallbacteria bacterium HGW-Wallbacteria-1 TaxID=2013854 RepID=A0A2N1PVD8_9BACT|nr:MAG: hypothetical protein CVV64_02280 [Candidatus Wallbacteria bacterium HGW-Wallbacteria-1]
MNFQSTSSAILRASQIICNGGIALFPTDTVYGLCSLPSDKSALERIYSLKGRPREKLMGLYLSDPFELNQWVEADDTLLKTVISRLPGPYTFILNRKSSLPSELPEPFFGPTLGIRCPAQMETLSLIRSCGGSLAGTSANLSGAPDVWLARNLDPKIRNGVDFLLESSMECDLNSHKIPSTIIDLTEHRRIIRMGAGPVDKELEELITSL